MSPDRRLLLGPVAAALFVVGVWSIGALLPSYDFVRQDVSEIGAAGLPTRIPFAITVVVVAVALLGFSLGLRASAEQRGLSAWPAHLIPFVVVSEIGIAVFALPHPLHEPFGLLSLIGFQAPGVLAATWRRDTTARGLVMASWIAFAALWLSTVLILGQELYPPLGRLLSSLAGLVQRSLFFAWFGWCAFAGSWLYVNAKALPRWETRAGLD